MLDLPAALRGVRRAQSSNSAGDTNIILNPAAAELDLRRDGGDTGH